jgi:hypothetical protein
MTGPAADLRPLSGEAVIGGVPARIVAKQIGG